MTPFRETKASEWHAAKLRGERLPPHEIPDPNCSLCNRRCGPDDFNEVADMFICEICLESLIDAPAVEPRAEVGLVGTGYSR